MKTIPSILNPQTTAYRLTKEWNWSQRGDAPLSLYIEQFATYGDGTTQHSGAWPAQWAELADVCLSLATAIHADPLCDDWRQLSYIVHSTAPETLAFVLTIKHRPDKPQWFSFSERKISSSESKRHDRRWTAVESWMDGTPATALSILLNSIQGVDWLGKLCLADDLRDAAGYPTWEEFFPATKELQGDWHQAFRAFRAAAEAVRQLEYVGRAVESARYNSTPKTEPAVAAVS